MILLIVYSLEEFQLSSSLENHFEIFETKDIYNTQSIPNNTWKKDPEEGWANEVAKKIKESNQQYSSIIIDKYQNTGNWRRAVRLGGHIALTLDDDYLCPIFLTDFELINIESIELKDLPILDFFQCKGVHFKSYSELFEKQTNKLTGKQEYVVEQLLRKCDIVNWEEFNIPFKHDNRHQISNEWGAISLTMNAGYEKSEISYDHPGTLYFKFLQKKFQSNPLTSIERREMLNGLDLSHIPEVKIDLSSLLTRKKILLIDDNSEEGWQAALETIFNCEITTKKCVKDTLNMTPQEYSGHDLVFFDLYLPLDFNENPTNIYSFELLKGLKTQSPEIPVIVFTASNKSWSFDRALNQGADEIYVKESPLFARDKEYSKENFLSFLRTVRNCTKKYSVLRPFWEGIEEVKNNYIPLIVDSNNAKFRSRITERLDMFYGLVKRGFEEKKYNKEKFFFDDNELSFMTLWSILNEIQEACFEKTRPSIELQESNGNTVSQHPNGHLISYLPHQFRWQIRNQTDTYVEYEYTLEYDDTGAPKVNNDNFYKLRFSQVSKFNYQNDVFVIGTNQPKRTNFETTLFMQIAFLIESMDLLSTANKNRYQQELVDLNKIRNHLYFTHGSNISTNFHSHTEADKRKGPAYNITPKGDIKRLFELIGFLLTGKEIRVSV